MSSQMARPKIFKYSAFNLDALLSLAGALRSRPCTCDISKPPFSGSLNWAVVVSFDDGVEWIFRSPLSGERTFFSEKYSSRMLASEVATLNYVRTRSLVPVPEVFAHSASRENDIGVPYILMSKASGHPLSEYDWLSSSSDTPRPLSKEGREKVMGQLGAITWQLSQLRLDKIGSLFQDDDGHYTVGECLSPSLTWQHRDLLEEVDRGPFDGECAYFKSLISAYISHAQELPLTPHAFFAPFPDESEYTCWASYKAATSRWNDFVAIGQKIDHSKNRLAYCIAGQLMHDMIPSLCSHRSGDGFPLGHPDLHHGNIYVDEALNITCIIDWGSSSSIPLAELLATPRSRGSTFPPDVSLVAAFRGGFDRASGNEQFGWDMWKRADTVWYFQRVVRMLSIRDYHDFEVLYALVHKPDGERAGPGDIPRLFDERAQRYENRKLLDELGKDDLSQDYVKRQEQAAFGSSQAVNSDRLALARKLTLMSEMNKRFVADRRLWRWIEDTLEDIGTP